LNDTLDAVGSVRRVDVDAGKAEDEFGERLKTECDKLRKVLAGYLVSQD
jgi:hypothetical protein